MSKNSVYRRDDIDYLFELLERNEPTPGPAFDLKPEMFQEDLPANIIRFEESRQKARSGFVPNSLIAAGALIAVSALVALLMLLGNSGVMPVEVVESLPSPAPVTSTIATKTPVQTVVRRYNTSSLVFDGTYLQPGQEYRRSQSLPKPPVTNSTYGFWQW